MSTPLKTRILLVDDHGLVREGLRMVLDAQPDLEVVAEAGDGVEALEIALAGEIDLAVLDVAMPRMTGLQAARELQRRRPEMRVLMLSMHDNEQYFFEALKVGASGYVLKSGANRDLVEACRAAMRGQPFLYPAAVTALIRDYFDRETSPDAPPGHAHATRAGRHQADRRGPHERGDRRDAHDRTEDRRSPSCQRAGEAGDAQPRRPDPLRDPPWSRRALSAAAGARASSAA